MRTYSPRRVSLWRTRKTPWLASPPASTSWAAFKRDRVPWNHWHSLKGCSTVSEEVTSENRKEPAGGGGERGKGWERGSPLIFTEPKVVSLQYSRVQVLTCTVENSGVQYIVVEYSTVEYSADVHLYCECSREECRCLPVASGVSAKGVPRLAPPPPRSRPSGSSRGARGGSSGGRGSIKGDEPPIPP